MVFSSLVGGKSSYPWTKSGAVCRPCQMVSCTTRLPSTSTETASPCMSGNASSTRRKRSTNLSEPIEVLPRVWSTSTTSEAVSYTHLRAHETDSYLVCRLLLEK